MAKKNHRYSEQEVRKLVEIARLQGRTEAEEYLERRIEKICATNNHLLAEIMRLDKKEAVSGVLIPYKFADKIVRKLRKSNRKDHHATMMKHYMNKSDAAVFGGRDIVSELES